MIYISRNYKFDTDNNKAFEIYSDSTCEHLEYTCNYHDMIEILNDNIRVMRVMLEGGLIDHKEAWDMKDNYILYNQAVKSLENVDC